jgi:uncharacterized protein YjiS (DUF1127 family)
MANAFAAKGFAGRVAAAPPESRSALRVLATAFEWYERARQRRELYALDERMLKDIGLTRVDVEREASKHFWIR